MGLVGRDLWLELTDISSVASGDVDWFSGAKLNFGDRWSSHRPRNTSQNKLYYTNPAREVYFLRYIFRKSNYGGGMVTGCLCKLILQPLFWTLYKMLSKRVTKWEGSKWDPLRHDCMRSKNNPYTKHIYKLITKIIICWRNTITNFDLWYKSSVYIWPSMLMRMKCNLNFAYFKHVY